MRKSFDSLCGLIENDLSQNPTNGTVYIFINKFRNKIKLLHQISGNGSLELNDAEKAYSFYGPMKMAALVKTDLIEGHILSLKDFSFKRTKEQTDLSQVDIINL